MKNIDIINAMANYIKENGCNHDYIVKNEKNWMTASEWESVLGIKISIPRLTAMYNEGLVLRHKDRKYYGDNVFHYWPTTLEVNAW